MTHAQPQKKSLWNMNVDLMHGPILKSLLLFMLPILVSNLFQQLYNTVDTMIVGNVLGDTALAAIGSCGSIYELLVGFGIGIGNGLAIVAARSYGAQDEDLLKRTVVGSVVIGLIASLVITAAGFFGLHALLQLLDTPAEILEDAYSYIIVIDLGVVVMFMYNLCAGLLRAIGNSVMPLVFLLISSVLNVGLDLWFIAGVGMGVRGAAVATVIAQGISVVLCVLYVLARVRILIPEKKHFAVGSHLYWELFSQSISMGLMSSIVSAGSVILQYGINGLGTLTIAGHTAARKLFAFTDMPLIAMANAALADRRGDTPENCRADLLRKIYWIQECYDNLERDYLDEIDANYGLLACAVKYGKKVTAFLQYVLMKRMLRNTKKNLPPKQRNSERVQQAEACLKKAGREVRQQGACTLRNAAETALCIANPQFYFNFKYRK